MSATDAKQQRKQARKAIGETGLSVLGQHSQDLRLMSARLNELEAMLVMDRRNNQSRFESAERMIATLFAPSHSLRLRLRWLLTGR